MYDYGEVSVAVNPGGIRFRKCSQIPEVLGDPTFHADPPPSGERAILPREVNVQRSPLAELGTAPVIRRGQRRAAVWVGLGATARPREARSSRLAAVLGCVTTKIFSKIRMTATTSQAYYSGVRSI